ncbi:MAG: GNAT family N-acetyltransferase [Alphaproteobacteria bacterium]|nr:GNAT family N-acetyltransferase [Alphaproteobacteria bacterium]
MTGIAGEVAIRMAGAGDADAIGRVQAESWRSTYPGLVPDRVLVAMTPGRQARLWRRHLTQRSMGTVFVAEIGGRGVVGFGSCGREQSGDTRFDGEVYTLYIDDEFHGQGVGRRLVDTMFRRLERSGSQSALIWVLKGNPARFFYAAIGGALVGERESQQWGETIHELAYGWRDLNGVA